MIPKYSSLDWKKIRLRILERDGFQCSVCKEKNIRLIVHHVDENPLNDSELRRNGLITIEGNNIKISEEFFE